MSDLVQNAFDYSLLDESVRVRIQVKAESIKSRMKRTAEDIIVVGEDFLDVKQDLDHGQFKSWLKTEFDMSYDTALNFMQAAKKFGNRPELKNGNFPFLSVSVLYELSAPSTPDTVVSQVQSGEIPPTLEEIKKAKEALRQAKLDEAKARADAQATQQRLLNLTDVSHKEIEELNSQIKSLQQEIESLSTPEVEIRQVEKEVIPPSVTSKIENLQQQVKRLTDERNVQKERLEKLTGDLQTVVRKGIVSEGDERIRQNWRSITNEVHSSLMRLLVQWPTPIDAQSFDADDWVRLDQLKNTLRRLQEECDHLRYGGDGAVVDEHSSSYVLSLAHAQVNGAGER